MARVRRLWILVMFATATLLASEARAMAVLGDLLNDLPDTSPGQDLWEWRYAICCEPWPAGQGFNVYFDPSDGYMVNSLVEPQRGLAGWQVQVTQPSASTPGVFRAIAEVDMAEVDIFPPDDPSLYFVSTFVWSGSGPIHNQIYEIFDADGRVLDRNYTQGIPEPEAALLLLEALTATCLARTVRRMRCTSIKPNVLAARTN